MTTLLEPLRIRLGRPVVDSTAAVEFFLSPRGFLGLFLAATIGLTIRLVEHAGLSAMVLGALEGKRIRAVATFRWLIAELPRLASLGARVVGWGVLVVMPLLGVAAVFARRLLAKHDRDFSRMAGVAKKVWDLTYAEIRAIPLGAQAAPEFRHEPEKALRCVRGHEALSRSEQMLRRIHTWLPD